MKTFDDVKQAIQDLVASEVDYESAIADDDASHAEVAANSAALAASQAKAAGTNAAKVAKAGDVKAKTDELMSVLQEYEAGLLPQAS